MLVQVLSFVLAAAALPQDPIPADGAVTLRAGDRPGAVYRARQVDLPDGFLDQVAASNRRYAVPRSGYLHPLFGPDGEVLTADWSRDHPHHRGVYWAWPEVQWGDRRGDLHALQEVFARPVGEPTLRMVDGAQVLGALNLWLWHDEEPLVCERVHLAARPGLDCGHTIDLALSLQALVPGITLARRNTDLYGGLNVRLAPVADLALDHHGEPATAEHKGRAWSCADGIWPGGKRKVTFAILEHPANPDFPGDFVTYPELPWFQPTFPRAGTRYPLQPGQPLVLRYRLWIAPGEPDPRQLAARCDEFAATPSPFLPAPTENDR
jgi:hypothetical protein